MRAEVCQLSVCLKTEMCWTENVKVLLVSESSTVSLMHLVRSPTAAGERGTALTPDPSVS